MQAHRKLMEIVTKLNAPKNQYNEFGKFNYRSCEDIMEAAKPLLREQEAVIILSDEIVYIEGRFYVRATASFVDVSDGMTIQNFGQAREENEKKGMDGSQITGAASSYARKYALNGLLGISDNEDMDKQGSKPTIDPKKAPGTKAPASKNDTAPKTDDFVPKMKELLKIAAVEEQTILDHYKIKDLKELTADQRKEAVVRVKLSIENNKVKTEERKPKFTA